MNLLREIFCGWKEISVEGGKRLEEILRCAPTFSVTLEPSEPGPVTRSYYRVEALWDYRVFVGLEHIIHPYDKPLKGTSSLKQCMGATVTREDVRFLYGERIPLVW